MNTISTGYWFTFTRGLSVSHLRQRHSGEQNFCHFRFGSNVLRQFRQVFSTAPLATPDKFLFDPCSFLIKVLKYFVTEDSVTSAARWIQVIFAPSPAVSYWQDMIVTSRPLLKAISTWNHFSQFWAITPCRSTHRTYVTMHCGALSRAITESDSCGTSIFWGCPRAF